MQPFEPGMQLTDKIQQHLKSLPAHVRNRKTAQLLMDALDEIHRLNVQLADIRDHWQRSVKNLDNPWKYRMAELVGDVEE